MFTTTHTADDGSKFVTSESESADRKCYLHIVTRFGEFGLETEFSEYDHEWGNLVRTEFVHHRASRLPAALRLHAMHEHVLAIHQALFRVKRMPYLAHVAMSVLQQLKTEFVIRRLHAA